MQSDCRCVGHIKILPGIPPPTRKPQENLLDAAASAQPVMEAFTEALAGFSPEYVKHDAVRVALPTSFTALCTHDHHRTITWRLIFHWKSVGWWKPHCIRHCWHSLPRRMLHKPQSWSFVAPWAPANVGLNPCCLVCSTLHCTLPTLARLSPVRVDPALLPCKQHCRPHRC